MMANLGALIATLGVDTSELDKADDKVKSFDSKTSKAFLKLSGVIAGAFSAKAFINIADSMTLVEGRLSLVTKSSEELISVQKDLLDLANESRVGFRATADLYARLARSTSELGVSQKQLLTVTESINKAMIVSGASAEEANAAIIQLSQGLASGALRGDELRSVLEQTPRLAQAIASGMGVTIGQLRELGAAGELTTQAVLGAILSQSGKIREEFSKMAPTVGQAFTILNNEIGYFIAGANKSTSATQLLASGIVSLSRIIRQLGESDTTKTIWDVLGRSLKFVTENTDKLIYALKILAIHYSIKGISSFSRALLTAATNMLTLKKATDLASTAGKALGRVFLYGAILQGIELIWRKWKQFSKLVKETPATWGTVGKIATDQLVNSILNGIIALGNGINNVIRVITDPLLDAFTIVGKSIPDLLFRQTTIEEVANNIGNATKTAFKTALARVGDDFSTDMNRRLIKIASDADLALLSKLSKDIEPTKATKVEPIVPESSIIAGVPSVDLAKQQAQNYEMIITGLNDRLWGDTLSAADKYYQQQQQLEDEFNTALLLSGDDKVKALQAYQNKAMEMAQEVKEGNEVIISSEDAIADAIGRVQSAQQAIIATQDNMRESQMEWITSLDESAMDATQILNDLEGNLDNIDNKMSSLVIEMDGTQAEITINSVKSMIDSIPDITTKTIKINTSDASSIESLTSGGISGLPSSVFSDIPIYHNGTDFVPKTGPAILQKGESVIPAGENKRNQGLQFNMGDVIIQGADKDPEQLADELVRPIRDKLRELDYILSR